MTKLLFFHFRLAGALAILVSLCACSGILSNIYDEPTTPESVDGQVYVDASSWSQWVYLDFSVLDIDPNATPTSETIAIPTKLTGEPENNSGVYDYWFDVFGEGLSNNHFVSYSPTDAQRDPDSWTLAFHRESVRTNGGSVLKTKYLSFDELPANSKTFEALTFTPDEWTENKVWVNQSKMMSGIVGSQGIDINNTLSSWLICSLPPIPPAYTMDNSIYILRLSDGRFMALQLLNYLSPTNTKCCLTIKYKYPY